MSKQDEKIGAAKSLNKTITEIEAFLQTGRERPSAHELREVLHEQLADLAEKWFKKGFKRGCIEAQRAYRTDGIFPERVRYDGNRELFTGRDRDVRLSWKTKAAAKPARSK